MVQGHLLQVKSIKTFSGSGSWKTKKKSCREWNLDITKGQGTRKNLFAIRRFCYIEVLFNIIWFITNGSEEYHSLYRGPCYIELRYKIEEALYKFSTFQITQINWMHMQPGVELSWYWRKSAGTRIIQLTRELKLLVWNRSMHVAGTSKGWSNNDNYFSPLAWKNRKFKQMKLIRTVTFLGLKIGFPAHVLSVSWAIFSNYLTPLRVSL